MKRRTFLKSTVPALAVPMALNGMRFNALAQSPSLQHLFNAAVERDRIIVIIQMDGGNDGLNTVIPVEDDLYYNLRPSIGIKKDQALPLDGNPLLRLHPDLKGFQELFNDGRLAVVNNIGYDNYSLSHFQGTEIWNTGSGSDPGQHYESGWIGRFLEKDFPDYPRILPDHPPALQIRPAVSSVFSSGNSTIGLAVTDPTTFYELVNGSPSIHDDPAPDTLPGHEWNFIRAINTQAVEFAGVIREAADKARNRVEYPALNDIASALAIVARLIAGGLKTRVYMVSLKGFDTHINQLFVQSLLLKLLGSAVKAFMDDLAALGVGDRVVGMTYSEFGRRIKQNSTGTDHGGAAPHFVFGAPVDGGKVHGALPDLTDPDQHGNLRHKLTFQCYYASVLGPFFRLPEDRLQQILPVGLCDAPERPALYHGYVVGVAPDPIVIRGLSSSPNPASTETTIHYSAMNAGHARLTLHAADGRTVHTVLDGYQDAGPHSVRINLAGLPSGTYICRLRFGDGTRSQKIVVQR